MRPPQVYGMSENSGPHTISRTGAAVLGSVGKTVTGVETLIFEPNAEGHGEICMRGRHVFKG